MAREAGLKCRVMDEKELARLGMGGILAVGGGSIQTPPRMIVLEHRPAKGVGKTLLVVGKAITFDTGGNSIKPADKMGNDLRQMRGDDGAGIDVCGGEAEVAGAYGGDFVECGERHQFEGVSAGGHSQDVQRRDGGGHQHRCRGAAGAGGCLAWGIEKYRPGAVVDLATLTGGVVVALGKTMAGVMGNSDMLVKELTEAGEAEGEKIWRLPLGEDQRDFMKSECADILNAGGREGHPLQGGAFLSYFVPEDESVPWRIWTLPGWRTRKKSCRIMRRGDRLGRPNTGAMGGITGEVTNNGLFESDGVWDCLYISGGGHRKGG